MITWMTDTTDAKHEISDSELAALRFIVWTDDSELLGEAMEDGVDVNAVLSGLYSKGLITRGSRADGLFVATASGCQAMYDNRERIV